MLPDSGSILKKHFKVRQQPSKAYRISGEHVRGYVDGLDAVTQAVYCILNTERYEYVIYGWNYGVELKDLFGKPMGVVRSKIKKRIREALTQDDRIRGVDAFSFTQEGRRLHVHFMVRTVFGDVSAEREVDV